jgi:hypothetical protein
MSTSGRYITAALLATAALSLPAWGTATQAAVEQAGQQTPQPPGRGAPPQDQPPATQTPAPRQPQFPPLPEPAKDKPAVSVPPPLYPTTPAVDKKFTFERVFSYRVMTYKPQIVIQKITRAAASNATPEQAFAAQMSAMFEGDHDWWLSNWDAAAQKFHKDRDAQMKRSAADWRGIWDRALKGQQPRLIDRVVTGPMGPYVMLLYELYDASGKSTYKSSFVAKEEAGRWVATLDLSEDPLFHYYELGRDRVSVTER